jgi:broad specificity phosphatase PhoE
VFRLYFIAHAPTSAQRQLRFPADEGIEPVDAAVTRGLLAGIRSLDAVWCGPERRSVETAAALGFTTGTAAAPGLTAERAGASGLIAEPCPDLGAWSVGRWAGQPVLAVAEDDPDGFQAWRTDPDARPHDGESLRTLLERVGGWLERQAQGASTGGTMMAGRSGSPGRALAVAEPAVIRAALVHVLDAEPRTFWRLDIAPLSTTIVQHAQGEWRLRSFGHAAGSAPDHGELGP